MLTTSLDTHKDTAPPSLTKIRDRINHLKDLLIAADMLGMTLLDSEGGPLQALLTVSLAEARSLDNDIEILCESGVQA